MEINPGLFVNLMCSTADKLGLFPWKNQALVLTSSRAKKKKKQRKREEEEKAGPWASLIKS